MLWISAGDRRACATRLACQSQAHAGADAGSMLVSGGAALLPQYHEQSSRLWPLPESDQNPRDGGTDQVWCADLTYICLQQEFIFSPK